MASTIPEPIGKLASDTFNAKQQVESDYGRLNVYINNSPKNILSSAVKKFTIQKLDGAITKKLHQGEKLTTSSQCYIFVSQV